MESPSTCTSSITTHLISTRSTGEHEALINIATGDSLRGELPRTARRLVEQRRVEHVDELQANWALAQEPAELKSIEPLS